MASIQETLAAGRKGYTTLVAADPPRAGTFRRVVLPMLFVTVLSGFVAIVWFAWQDEFAGRGEPPLIRAAPGPIKRPPDTPGGVDFEGERHGMASLLGGAPPQPRVERLLPREPPPPKSLAEADPSLLAPPPPSATSTPAVTPSTPTGGLGASAGAAEPVVRAAEPVDTGERTATVPPVAQTLGGPAAAPSAAVPSAADSTSGPAPAPPPDAIRAMPRPVSGSQASGSTASAAVTPASVAPHSGAAQPPDPSASSPPVPPTAPPAFPPAAVSPARPAAPAAERLAAREPATAPLSPSAGRGPWGVQIAAVSSREAAERGWAQLRSRHPEVLGPLGLRIDEARLANGLTLYRLQGFGFADRDSAARACARLKAAGTECFVVGGR